QHVIEEAQAGGYPRVRHAVQVDLDPDARFTRITLHDGGARRVGQRVGDTRPVPLAPELRGAQLESADAHVAGEAVVGFAIPDHGRPRPVDAAVFQQVLRQADTRLAGGCIVRRPADVDQYFAEGDALAFQHLHHQLLGPFERFL